MGENFEVYYVDGIKIKVIRKYVETATNLIDRLIDIFLKQDEQEDIICQLA